MNPGVFTAIRQQVQRSQGETAAQIVAAYASRVEADGGITESLSCLQDRIALLQSLGLWDKASAVWIPSAYKESKFYAAKGGASADLTHVRGGTRYRKGATYVEPVPYNLIRYSQGGFNNTTYWIKLGGAGAPTVQDNIATAPDGTLTASRITCNDVGAYGIRQTISPSISLITGTWTFSFWARSDNGAVISGDVDDTATPGVLNISLTTEWVRYSGTVTAIMDTGGFVDIAFNTSQVGKTFELWGVQLVIGSEALDYFKTTDRFNVPALDYTNDTCPAWSIEPARTNLITYSEDLSDASYSKLQVTISSNSVIAPDGLTTADKMAEVNNSAFHYIQKIPSGNFTGVYALSMYLKAAERTKCQIVLYESTFTTSYALSLVDLAAQTASHGGQLESVGDGWYRFKILTTSVPTLSMRLQVLLRDDADAVSYTGVTGYGMYVWGIQCESGSYATSYIPTTSATASRIADSVSALIPEGTNIFTQSEAFDLTPWTTAGTITVTANAANNPSGVLTADRLQIAAGSTRLQSITMAAGFQYTISCWVKAVTAGSKNLFRFLGDGTSQGANQTATGEWQRFEYTFTCGTSGLRSNGIQAHSTASEADIYVWGAQLEKGSVATTYLPTTTTPVHDGSVIGQTEGTLYFEGSSFADGTQKQISLHQSGSGGLKRLTLAFNASNQIQYYLSDSGAVVTMVNGGFSSNTNYKICLVYSPTYAAMFINGIKIGEDVSLTVPTLNELVFTDGGASTSRFYGNIKALSISNVALTDAQAISATA